MLLLGLAACASEVDVGESTDEARVALNDSTTLASGGLHTCAARWDGAVNCWGDNSSGQLGNGTTTASLVPVLTSGIGNAVAVTAGAKHACALGADGRVQCWGGNSEGQLGDGSNLQRTTPVFVSRGGVLIGNVIAIAAGDFHTCALFYDGHVECWGLGTSGQLGNAASNSSNLPVTVAQLTTAVTLAGGAEHTCASLANGEVRCWGLGTSGQLGNGGFASSNVPVTVAGMPAGSTEQVTAGRAHTCGLLTDGNMRCWGDNAFGQLAMTPGAPSAVPVNIPQPIYGRFKSAIAAGDDFTCAVGTNGAVACWGRNQFGQLGRGANPTPPPDHLLDWVHNLPTTTAIAMGAEHGCAQQPGGTLQCWGRNASGQLGDGTAISRATPAPVSGFSGGLRGDLAPGSRHTCALRFDGQIKCWGDNALGQLGIGNNINQPIPVLVPGIGNVEVIDSGFFHTCAVLGNGNMRCWGDNATYQLGDGTQNPSNVPIAINGSDVVDIALGAGHTCALTSFGRVRCWGDNTQGQVGDGTAGNLKPNLTQVANLTDAIAIDAGRQHTCALRQTGQVVCWGDNSVGQLGANFPVNASTPQPVTLPAAAIELGLGVDHSCAVLVTGRVACWGQNGSWQSIPNGPLQQPTPAIINNIETAREVAAGWDHSCAILATGQVMCWGSDVRGQIGNGGALPGPAQNVATLVPSLANVNHLELGANHTFTLLASGRLSPWGSNVNAQLGDNSGLDQASPVLTVSFP